MLRREDDRLLTGHGLYVDDLQPENVGHAVVVRSAFAHARLLSVTTDDAKGVPGVLTVLTGEDLLREGVGPMRSRTPMVSHDGTPMIEPDRPALAQGQVKYAGQPVAMIVADSKAAALEAAELVDIDYEDLEPVTDLDRAVAPDAPQLWDAAPNNVSLDWRIGNGSEVDAAIAAADHVVELTVQHPRAVIAPVEPRGCLAEYDSATGKYVLHTPSQGVVMLRAAMAEALGVEETEMRVVTNDVGGSFAVKIWPYPEQILCLLAARLIGRPVKWVAERTESFVADAPGRGRLDRATLALTKDGRITAFRIDTLADMGAFLNAVNPSIVTKGAVRVFTSCYKIEAAEYRVKAVFTNATPTDAYRGAGKPESAGTLERIIDFACDKLGFDRQEIRAKNLMQPADLPFHTPMGEDYDGGDYPEIFRKALAKADIDAFSARRAASEAAGKRRGVGFGIHVHATGGSTAERSKVELTEDGRVRVRTGTQDSGQGHQTTLAQVAAEALGIDPGQVIVEQGDSANLQVGGGTGGSCLMPIAANTVHRAAIEMVENGKKLAGHMMETAVQDIEYEAGSFKVAGTDKSISFPELMARMGDIPPETLEPGLRGGCVGEMDFEGKHTTFPNGAYVVEVEVDPETGRVAVDRFVGLDDLGRIVNEPLAFGQVTGGIAQAIGEVLMEGSVFDEDSGQLLTGSLMDYAFPRADDVPFIDHEWAATPSPNSLLGVKGVGEVPSIGGPGPIMNAVIDALSPYGVKHIDIPMTPEKIWSAIHAND
ncbi:xanthine dehydrogenase family protein molybdopterin-binding subunit [Nisaea acidiphila]|uniref:Xanthine dehydrogenase family protein molybdopterin-binding subunit n=1 Tax=Nisaea acidiphila TaxID=1862145 RepID=A0A9J7ANH2_9PROT|nr:xanthine dehydrogenase family protein molybdopterin-binding subunit [Nisaea acidiphila]UUX49187.1 xanthine dehydrogenase family protein molybdopterin-binding subunit [Nisaea acidiphila]